MYQAYRYLKQEQNPKIYTVLNLESDLFKITYSYLFWTSVNLISVKYVVIKL